MGVTVLVLEGQVTNNPPHPAQKGQQPVPGLILLSWFLGTELLGSPVKSTGTPLRHAAPGRWGEEEYCQKLNSLESQAKERGVLLQVLLLPLKLLPVKIPKLAPIM